MGGRWNEQGSYSSVVDSLSFGLFLCCHGDGDINIAGQSFAIRGNHISSHQFHFNGHYAALKNISTCPNADPHAHIQTILLCIAA